MFEINHTIKHKPKDDDIHVINIELNHLPKDISN